MRQRREKHIEPKQNEQSLTYWIFVFLKNGVKSREDLIAKINNTLTERNIKINSKSRDINVKSIVSNTNEIIRYISENRSGWYRKYTVNMTDSSLKIERKLQTLEPISKLHKINKDMQHIKTENFAMQI